MKVQASSHLVSSRIEYKEMAPISDEVALRNNSPHIESIIVEHGHVNRIKALPHIKCACLLAKEGASIGTVGVQAWVRGASGGCGASSDGDARSGLYESRPLVKTTMSMAATATTPLAI